jgi:hypothetical protein
VQKPTDVPSGTFHGDAGPGAKSECSNWNITMQAPTRLEAENVPIGTTEQNVEYRASKNASSAFKNRKAGASLLTFRFGVDFR